MAPAPRDDHEPWPGPRLREGQPAAYMDPCSPQVSGCVHRCRWMATISAFSITKS